MTLAEATFINLEPVKKSEKSRRILIGLNNSFPGQDLLVSELEKKFDVLLLSDGAELIRTLPKYRPNVLLYESDLPGISGFQIAYILKENSSLFHLPTVLIVSQGYQIGEFWAKEMGVDVCYTNPNVEPEQLMAAIEKLITVPTREKIDETSWLRIEKEFSRNDFVESFSTIFDQVILESAIVNRIAMLAQEPTDFRKLARSIMLLLRDILEYSAGAIRIFRSNEIYSFVSKDKSETDRLHFLEEAEEYSEIYRPQELVISIEPQVEIPLGTFQLRKDRRSEAPTIFTIPLIARHTTIGTLTLRTYKSAAKREFYLKTLQLIAHHISLALNNALLYQEVHRLSTVDELTGLPNRRAFYEKFNSELVRSRRFGVPLSVAILDIDHFKNVNDTFGHLQGDFVLQECAKVFKTSIRDKIDIVARLGGEEFVVLLPQTDINQARIVVERLHRAIEAHNMELIDGSGAINITISIGLASLMNGKTYTVDEIINTADQALYNAKESGRNRIVEAPPLV